MNIIPKLATSLNRRDEVPNQELAAEVVKNRDSAAVAELSENLANRSRGIRHDCIKVLYEIGYTVPTLIDPFLGVFLDLLSSKDNRMQWGAMTAIACTARSKPDEVFAVVSQLEKAANEGSVITRDNYVRTLIELYRSEMLADRVFSLLADQLRTCPANQLPMYAEEALPSLRLKDNVRFADVLRSRLGGVEKESKRKRIQRVIEKALKQ